MAYKLLNNTNETNVCVFEREDRLGGKIFDFNFTQVPDVAVGELKPILHWYIFHMRNVLKMFYSGTVDFFERDRPSFISYVSKIENKS